MQQGGAAALLLSRRAAELSDLLQLYLIRHGETAWSLTGQHTGTTDIELTLRGEEEARALAPWLRKQGPFNHILSSPALRARQTCAMAQLGDTPEIKPDLAEWNYGDYEGQRSTDIQKARPDWNLWRDGCPHGETPSHVTERADRLLTRLRTLAGNIALFSHGQFGPALAARWIGMPMIEGQHFALSPASISILGHETGHGSVPCGMRSTTQYRPALACGRNVLGLSINASTCSAV